MRQIPYSIRPNLKRSKLMTIRSQSWQCALGLLLLLPLFGCGNKHQTAKVTGNVTVDGKPLPFGRVQFSPVGSSDLMAAGKSGFGYIQEDGSFHLSTFGENDGAVVGQHRVIITSKTRSDNNSAELKQSADIPLFETLRLVGQRFDVQKGENVINIALTAKQIRDYGEQE